MARKKNPNPPADYPVGRGKPPRETRFKPGQSGNPGGRKKGSRNMETIVKGVFDREIVLTENGEQTHVIAFEAIMLRLIQAALRGDPRAIRQCIELYERFNSGESGSTPDLADEDRALLQRFRGSNIASRFPGTAPDDDEAPSADEEGPDDAA